MNLQQFGVFFLSLPFFLSPPLFLSLSASLPPGCALLHFSGCSLPGGSFALVEPPQFVCYCHSAVSLEMSYLINTPQDISHLF